MNDHPLFRLTFEVISILDRTGTPYMLMGGMAVRFWALPRPTYDLDVTVAAGDPELAALMDRLDQEGFNVPPEVRKGWRDVLRGMRKFEVRKFEGRDSWRIDLFLVTTPYQQAAFDRRRRARLQGVEVWTIAPEDLILHKLMAARDRDMADVSDILSLARDLDRDHLNRWARELGVDGSLADVLRKAGLA